MTPRRVRPRIALVALAVVCVVSAAAPVAPVAAAPAAENTAPILSPLPTAPQVDPKQAALGRLLFFDERLSGDASTSCATCHLPSRAFAGADSLSVGYRGTLYFRNAPTVANAAHRRFFFWDGRLSGSDIPTLVRDHLTEHHFMAADGRVLIERMRQIPEYDRRFRDAFGGVSYGKILNAVSAYVRTLVSRDAPLDRYLAGEPSALSAEARRGLDLFRGRAGCVRCHTGALLSDGRFHRTGVPENPGVFGEPDRHITFRRFFRILGVPGYRTQREDIGRYAVTKEAADRGRFQTPSLREVGRTAPYMHNGVLATLEDVVTFYDRGGGPNAEGLVALGLTTVEKADLVAFLRDGLSGQLPDATEPDLPPYAVGGPGR